MKHLDPIRKQVKKHGSERKLALYLDYSQSLLWSALAGKRSVGNALAFKLEAKCGIDAERLLSAQAKYKYREFVKQHKQETDYA